MAPAWCIPTSSRSSRRRSMRTSAARRRIWRSSTACAIVMAHGGGCWSAGLPSATRAALATRMAGSMSDITERQRDAERQLQHDAFHDPLTGLPNRALFIDRLDQVVHRSPRDPPSLRGPVPRPRSLQAHQRQPRPRRGRPTAHRRRRPVRDCSTRRHGGPVRRRRVHDPAGRGRRRPASATCRRARAELARGPFGSRPARCSSTASIGYRSAPSGMHGRRSLLRNADIAMYDAKRRGQGRCAVFTEACASG